MEVIGRFTFDSENGLGSIPWNSNITYLGFIVYMKPGEFLRLNPPRNDHKSLNELKDYIIHNDVSIGPPLLEVKWDEESSRWDVIRHEGRGRMMAVESVQPDHLVPVHVVPSGMRARHVTPTMAKAYFMPDHTRSHDIRTIGLMARPGAMVKPSKVILNEVELDLLIKF